VFSPGGSVPFKFVANGGTWGELETIGHLFWRAQRRHCRIEYFDRLPDLGRLTITRNPTPFDVEVTLTWTGAAQIRVQTRTGLAGSWEDVPNTLGANTVTEFYNEAPNGRIFPIGWAVRGS
jgi:hypothetical protein